MPRILKLYVAAGTLLFLVGCPQSDSQEDDQPDQPPPGTILKLLVVDDPALATAVQRLEGEWNAQTGFGLEVEQIAEPDLDSAETIAADAVICPSYLLGNLAEKKQIVPVPKDLLEGERAKWLEVFGLLRSREAAWGTQIIGVPFGSPVLVCYYRADLLERLGRQPPRTWTEYQKLAEMLGDRKNLGDAAPPHNAPWHGTIEPLGPGWAGLMLLARAAPYATHRENYSTLFNIDTMEPLIDGPPFVRALEELVAAAQNGSPEQLTFHPAAVRKAFWAGHCGLALTWPTAADKESPAEASFPAGFAELPGSTEVYHVIDQNWDTRGEDDELHVPLLATSGRVGVVPDGCQWSAMAFELLVWLSDEKWSPQTSGASPATTLFRQAHLASPKAWTEKPVPADSAAEYALISQQTFGRRQCLLALRIPGRSEYLAALDAAVGEAVRGQATPQDALTKTADRWRKITQRLGTDRQRTAYWNSLGLD